MPRFASIAVAALLTFAAAASAGSTRDAETLPGTIAFSGGTQATGYQVFVAKPTGAIVQVTHEAVRRSVPASPVWSPDGSRFLVVGDDGIYVLTADGSSEIRVAGLANGYATQSVAWSPDSRRIAFSEADTLYIVNADGSGGLERLARPANAGSWSPNGRRIVYSGADSSRRPVLLIVNTVGRPRSRQLWPGTHGARRTGYPWATWSPDGSRIAFEYNNGYNPLGGWVYSIRPDGTGLRFLYRGDIGPWSQNWSPDGQTLIVTRGFNAIWKLFLVRADGTRGRLLPGCSKGCDRVTWFPDGKHLGYIESRAIYVARTDGSGRRLVARTHSPYDGGLSVSADGSTIAYTDGPTARDHNRNVYVVGADGTGRRVVAYSSTIRYWSPAWRPAGR
jgi:Tol biopolymer transport system component